MRFAHQGTHGERDACGTGFVASTTKERTHGILRDGLMAVARLEHRGAVSADGKTSDGAGILTHIPYALLDVEPGQGVGMVFLPRGDEAAARAIVDEAITSIGLRVLRWRVVPVDVGSLGAAQKDIAPTIEQVIVAVDTSAQEASRLLLYARKRIERAARLAEVALSVASLSAETIVYKALVVPNLLPKFYLDLADERFVTGVAIFHQRYSTNTFPSWRLAQPLRVLAHNGEINTLLGNVNRMKARHAELIFDDLGLVDGERLHVIEDNPSDSSALDNVVEILTLNGRNPVHALGMLVPDAFERKALADGVEAFYRYHALLTQPWDGPAALVFTNGKTVAASLDRNGLRPLRYWITKDRVVVGSEAGIVVADEADILEKGRLGPGQMLSVNLGTGRVFHDDEIKQELAILGDWQAWLDDARVDLPVEAAVPASLAPEALLTRQKTFGYGREHVEKILGPMLGDAKVPIGSMGDDTPLAALSEKPQRMFRYFKQRFAQVTNPPIDPLRERMVMSLISRMGGGKALLDADGPIDPFVEFNSPVLSRAEFESLAKLESHGFSAHTLDATFIVEDGEEGMRQGIAQLVRAAKDSIGSKTSLLMLSDRATSDVRAPIPMMLAMAAIHHALIDDELRSRAVLICDTADVIEDHDVACLVGFGALLVHPWLALETVRSLVETDGAEAEANYVSALNKGLLKIMAKYGISTIGSFQGAQTFEALGLGAEVVDTFFRGTPTRIGGATFGDLAASVMVFHAEAYGEKPRLREQGIYRFRRDGEYHAFNPPVFKALHKAVRENDIEQFREYTRLVDDRPPALLRDLITWRVADTPIPLDQVESADAIVRRFSTQAMSFGSLSREAHETLAIAMNRIGGKSNSGEGGEESVRFEPYTKDAPDRSLAKWHPMAGDSGSSAIKQVASGRFGVTPYYLVSARQLEIKMAQGAKPGEGGQIPGYKVTEDIAKTRRSIPGVTLISPPPHHDIYSIEDLAQLIYDLKHINSDATVAVKLVAGTGVGTIAAGVAKGYADAIQISGHDGGTGASPLSSIKHAGLPWELGLSEVQQTLAVNGLRGRVRLRVDGGLKTGRDVVIGALLGAEEFGFGTVPLVAAGCVMARQCHANTCPVGVATQREDLRARYPGRPEHVIAFMYFVAEHVRHILAQMGRTSLDDVIGRPELLKTKDGLPRRASQIDLSSILRHEPEGARRQLQPRNDRPEPTSLGATIRAEVQSAVQSGEPVSLEFLVANSERSLGAAISGDVARAYHTQGLPEGSINIRFTGQAGQSFGAFNNAGMSLYLEGEAQDYVGKSMAGGSIVIVSPPNERKKPDVLVGNTVLYGATGGSLFVDGQAGERFAVRNSGGVAVVLACGDHGCEYMTGGTVVVLGPTGYNFAAGMSGGTAYVYDPDDLFTPRLNDGFVQAERLVAGQELKLIVETFAKATKSRVARQILDAWTPELFWVIRPR